jgi:hypothetical protein
MRIISLCLAFSVLTALGAIELILFSAPTVEAQGSKITTEQAAKAAGATVTPTGPELRVQPKEWRAGKVEGSQQGFEQKTR